MRPSRAGGRPGEANPDFLNARLFAEETLAPFRDVFREHSGPFLLQFPPAPRSLRIAPPVFAAKLERFLAELPRDFRYAVELRDPALLTDDYRRPGHARIAQSQLVTAMPMRGGAGGRSRSTRRSPLPCSACCYRRDDLCERRL